MKWFVKCIKEYVTFTGRARRKEYWYFVLVALLLSIAANLIDSLFWPNLSFVGSLFSLFIVIPHFAVIARRLHDTGRSAKNLLWWIIAYTIWAVLLSIFGLSALVGILAGNWDQLPTTFLAILGIGGVVFFVWGILFVVWLATPGTPGENKYGPDPKQVAE